MGDPRSLLIMVDVDAGRGSGGVAADSCGACPFRSTDWDGGEPRGREICTCPAWQLPDVTGGVRHAECVEASLVIDNLRTQLAAALARAETAEKREAQNLDDARELDGKYTSTMRKLIAAERERDELREQCRLHDIDEQTHVQTLQRVDELKAELDRARPVLKAAELIPDTWLEMAVGSSQITRGLAPLAAAELARRAEKEGT